MEVPEGSRSPWIPIPSGSEGLGERLAPPLPRSLSTLVIMQPLLTLLSLLLSWPLRLFASADRAEPLEAAERSLHLALSLCSPLNK